MDLTADQPWEHLPHCQEAGSTAKLLVAGVSSGHEAGPDYPHDAELRADSHCHTAMLTQRFGGRPIDRESCLPDGHGAHAEKAGMGGVGHGAILGVDALLTEEPTWRAPWTGDSAQPHLCAWFFL